MTPTQQAIELLEEATCGRSANDSPAWEAIRKALILLRSEPAPPFSDELRRSLIGKSFTVKWCETCEQVYVECPRCGNNSCNGGHGEDGHCPVCSITYAVTDALFGGTPEEKQPAPPETELSKELRQKAKDLADIYALNPQICLLEDAADALDRLRQQAAGKSGEGKT